MKLCINDRMSLLVKSPTKSMTLNQGEARDLELKLNVTSKNNIWRYLGDSLYNFHISISKDIEMNVTEEEYEFLQRLFNFASWRECSHL